MAKTVRVWPNQLIEIPALRVRYNINPSPLDLGWAGSIGQLQDLKIIAAGLIHWLQAHGAASGDGR